MTWANPLRNLVSHGAFMFTVKKLYGSFSVSSIIRRKLSFFMAGGANSSHKTSHSEFDSAKKQRYDACNLQIRGILLKCWLHRNTLKLKCLALINAPINSGLFISLT